MLSYMSGIHIKICRALSSALKNLPDERIGIKAAGLEGSGAARAMSERMCM